MGGASYPGVGLVLRVIRADDICDMDVPAIIARADELNKANQWKEEYEYVCAYFQEVRDVELIWRIIRAYYRVGKHHLVKDVAEVARSGMGLYERALEINENNCNIQKVSPAGPGVGPAGPGVSPVGLGVSPAGSIPGC